MPAASKDSASGVLRVFTDPAYGSPRRFSNGMSDSARSSSFTVNTRAQLSSRGRACYE